MTGTTRSWFKSTTALVALALGAHAQADSVVTTTLNDQPVFAGADVPGNLALTLSVEFPTAISVANLNDYSDAATYQGYFDPLKCYVYNYDESIASNSYFQPSSLATGTYNHQCSGKWSGNFMNWATMQTIDPFRWALSGGYRSVDTTSMTILEKAWGATQGGLTNFPYRGTSQGGGNNLATTLVSKVTPFSAWTGFNLSIWARGNAMAFSGTTGYTLPSTSLYDLPDDPSVINSTDAQPYGFRVYIRVRVCDATTSMGLQGLESNCVKYGNNYKPEGLLQQYSNKIRFSAFSYLNGYGSVRQGGVLRESMGYIGPTYPQPLSTSVITNPRAEWDGSTGIMSNNPDSSLASASGVAQSGVMNYLNKFGEFAKNYMTYDNVGELFYAAVRYYENLGNVSQWTSGATSAELDGFPAVTNWVDPILYSCQKNFVLGIGDDHTWYDYDVGGSTVSGGRALPTAVSNDTINKAHNWTTALQGLEGMSLNDIWPFDSGATYYIAGLAYGTHVTDIRPDIDGMQTISTYWMDVMENQRAENLNPYYLAAKYGGFAVPNGYAITNTTPLDPSIWNSSGNSINMAGAVHKQPDNYFLAGNASQMVAGLKSAFTNIANAIKAYTTAFSFSTANVTTPGTLSFQAQYDSTGWTGVVTGTTLTFDSNGTPSVSTAWASSTTLETQLSGTGWQTNRNVVTWNGSGGVPFQVGNLTSSESSAMLPSYSSATTVAQYVAYLRGDRTNEVGSTVTGSTKSLRARALRLGDIVNATLTPVAAPNSTFSDASNPGYSAFKSTWASRTTMVYAGANDGMLHAFVGSNGTERFAYIPSALFQGPNSTPQVDGLAQLGNPNYAHHFYVDATPVSFDIDFARTGGATGSGDWHTVLIGGLGKGGKSFYAIDITNPDSMNTETSAAGKILWEFSDSSMGFSFGAPTVVKTAKYGWVVILTSGYNNNDTKGYLYLVNPKTGALLEKIATPSASAGLAQASAYVPDFSDSTADSAYVGDLNGALWRFDLTGTGSYPAPTQIAALTDVNGNAQPITTAPLIEIHPTNRKRYVMVGTGKLLASGDIASSAGQSFYAILDGSTGAFSAVSTPVTRADLQPVLDITAGVVLSPTSKGWYFDLGFSGGIGWRVVINPAAYYGIVSFTSLLTTGDACAPSGTSRVYTVNYANGTSVLSTATGASAQDVANGFITVPSSVIGLRFVNVNGHTELLGATAGGSVQKYFDLTNLGSNTRLLNWREVPTAE